MFVFGVLVNLLVFEEFVFGVPAVFDKGDGKPTLYSGVSVSQRTLSSKVFPKEQGEHYKDAISCVLPYPVYSLGPNANGMGTHWPNKTVPYEISPSIQNAERQMIQNAIEVFHENTCIKFMRKSDSDSDYVYFNNQQNKNCSSQIGRKGGKQEISLESPSCFTNGTVLHEMMHAVGFPHEQSRPDRDKYVIINEDNIEEENKHNFYKYEIETVNGKTGIKYDYQSLMHYGASYFSKNGKPTIEPKIPGIPIGPGKGFTEKDIQKLRKLYECD